MKILKLVLLSLFAVSAHGCPSCVGRVTHASPPFFSDEFYKPGAEDMDEIYQALKEVESSNIAHCDTEEAE